MQAIVTVFLKDNVDLKAVWIKTDVKLRRSSVLFAHWRSSQKLLANLIFTEYSWSDAKLPAESPQAHEILPVFHT